MNTLKATFLEGAGHFRQNKRTNCKIKHCSLKKLMTSEEKQELDKHINAIGKILYKQTKPEQVKTLARIEETVREQVLEYISPQIGIFLSDKEQEQM